MNRIFFALSLVGILVIAAVAYNVNYRTSDALRETARLRAEIARTREDVQVLEVEWAWLNAPDRLARLVAARQADLQLGPLVPERFGEAAQVPFPPAPEQDPLEAALAAALNSAKRSILGQEQQRVVEMETPGGVSGSRMANGAVNPGTNSGANQGASPLPRREAATFTGGAGLLPLLEDTPSRRLTIALGRPAAATLPTAMGGAADAQSSTPPYGIFLPDLRTSAEEALGQGAVTPSAASREDPRFEEAGGRSDLETTAAVPSPASPAAAGLASAPSPIEAVRAAPAGAAPALLAPPAPALTAGLARVATPVARVPASAPERATRAADPAPAFMAQIARAARGEGRDGAPAEAPELRFGSPE